MVIIKRISVLYVVENSRAPILVPFEHQCSQEHLEQQFSKPNNDIGFMSHPSERGRGSSSGPEWIAYCLPLTCKFCETSVQFQPMLLGAETRQQTEPPCPHPLTGGWNTSPGDTYCFTGLPGYLGSSLGT